MLTIQETTPSSKKNKRTRHPRTPKDHLLDHLECALLLSRQRDLGLTSYLVTLSIGSLDETAGGTQI